MLIDEVYKAVQDLSAKYQNSGYLAPDEFNRSAKLAQLDLITELYNSDQAPAFGSNLESEDMFSEVKASAVLTLSSGSVAKPSDYLLYSVAYGYSILNGEGKLVPLEYVTDKDWVERLGSFISAPDLNFPIIRMFGNNFEVRPDTFQNLHLNYLKVPLEPWWNYTVVSGEPVFAETGGVTTNPNAGVTAGDSTDFTLGRSEFSQLVWKLCRYLGLQIRDADLYQLSETENKTD